MDKKQFIQECNRSPLFKKYLPITINTLQETSFLKETYEINDLKILSQLLFFIMPQVNTNIYRRKDILHFYLLKKYDNQILIKNTRKALKMSYTHKGLSIPNKLLQQKNYINIILSNSNNEYNKWLIDLTTDNSPYTNHKQNPTTIATKADNLIHIKIFNILEKWDLPIRYYDSLIELVLFNRIIPADPNIKFKREFILNANKKPQMSIIFDIDTTKKELLEFIKDDPFDIFTKKKNFLPGKLHQQPRKDSEIQEILRIYNTHKRDGMSDKKIFTLIKQNPKFKHISISGIRDRIKR